MEIFEKLGIDATLFIQMGLFLIVYAILHFFVFAPLFQAHKQREDLTLSDEEGKQDKLKMIEKLKNDYEGRLHRLHHQIQNIFSKIKDETNGEVAEKIAKARENAKDMIAVTRKQRAIEKIKIQKQMEEQIPALLNQAMQKILGK